MPKKTTDLAGEVTTILKAYSDEVRQGIDKLVPEMGKQAVKELKVAGDFKDRTKKYRKGWTSTVEKTRMGVVATVHNKQYQLTHLLEYGHAKQNGGRTREFPHIANVEQEISELFTRKVEELAQ